jgi:hypothetical protein
VAAAGLATADKVDQASTTAYNQGAAHGQEAQAQTSVKAQDDSAVAHQDATVAQLQAEVARLRKLQPGPVQPARAPGALAPVAVPLPVGSPLAVTQDQLVAALTLDNAALKKDLADTNALLATKTAEADSYHQAADGFKAEAAGLRVVVGALAAAPRHWAAGVTYGSNGTAGATVERDLGPFRVGVDVVRCSTSTGNSTLEAMARAAWRF